MPAKQLGAQAASMIDNRYIPEKKIGQGGAAIVLRCIDSHIGAAVAVKLLRPGNPLTTVSKARFHREARLVSSLNHPNIIRALDYGESAVQIQEDWANWMFDKHEKLDFLCMEYIPGPTLKQLMRKTGPVPQGWALTIALQVADAIRSAHSAGIIHRDIKPQNIMLLDADTHVVAKLGDFGIARDLNGGSLFSLTQTGQILGTPDYLAPEQVLGDPGGKQADIYAFGIVLYELLTGKLPFEGENPLAAASRRMFTDPLPLRSFVSTISPALEEVTMRCLQREQRDRIGGAEEAIEALEWAQFRDEIEPTDIWPFSSELRAISFP